MKTLVSFLSILLFTSCFSTYQMSNLLGSYYAVKIDADRYEVTYEGESSATAGYVKSIFLYRCAYTAMEANCAYFIILSQEEGEVRKVIKTRASYFVYEEDIPVEVCPNYYRSGVIQVMRYVPENYDGTVYHARDIVSSMDDQPKSDIKTIF